MLNADNRFALAAIAPLATPVVTIAALFTFAARFGVAVLCIGTVVGVFVECAALGMAVRRMGYPLLPSWSGIRMPELRGLRHQYSPLAASGIITSGCIVADQVVAGRLSPGSVSAWTYGTKLSTVILAIAAAAASAVVLPAFSQLAATQNWRRLRNSVRLYCGVALLLSLPTAAFLIAASGPIVRIFFEHGEFQASAAQLVTHIQRFALIEVPFTLLLAIVARLASALSANRLLLWMGASALITDIVLDIVLSRMMGVAGIALASAAVEMVSFLVLVILLCRHSPQAFREVKA